MYKKSKSRVISAILSAMMIISSFVQPTTVFAEQLTQETGIVETVYDDGEQTVTISGEELETEVTVIPEETEAANDLAFYAGHWEASSFSDDAGIVYNTFDDGTPLYYAMQLDLTDDGRAIYFSNGTVKEGAVRSTADGVSIKFSDGSGLTLTMGQGVLSFSQDSRNFTLERVAKDSISVKATTLEVVQWDTVNPATAIEGQWPGYAVTIVSSNYDNSTPGDYTVLYTATTQTGMRFSITQSIVVKAAETSAVIDVPAEETGASVETEQVTEQQSETMISTEPVTESETTVETESEAESTTGTVVVDPPEVINGTGADKAPSPETESESEFSTEVESEMETESETLTEITSESETNTELSFESESDSESSTDAAAESNTQSASSFSKTFSTITDGGTMRITSVDGTILAELRNGETIVFNWPDDEYKGINDVTVELIADDGFVVDSFMSYAEANGITAEGWCRSSINLAEWSKGVYLGQLSMNESFHASFKSEGSESVNAVAEVYNAANSAEGGEDPEVGDSYSGRAYLSDCNSPAGKTYNGTGWITCSSGFLEGLSFQMSTCTTGHDGAIPLVGQTGSYVATVTAVDKVNGIVSLYISWANDYDYGTSGYQSLATNSTITHNYVARVKVTKVAGDNLDVSEFSAYSLAGAEFTLYSGYDAATGKLSGKIGTMVTGSSGKTTLATAIEVDAGTYYVKETKAPKGFRRNDNVYTIEAPAGVTTVKTIKDKPKYGQLAIHKVDKATGMVDPSLKGARYVISDNREFNGIVDVIDIDALGEGRSSAKLMLGMKYYVKETSAPDGWDTDDTIHSFVCKDDDSDDAIMVHNMNLSDERITTGIKIVKHDSTTKSSETPSSEYSLKGAVYTVYTDKSQKLIAGTITLDADGEGALKGLENGTYYVKETTPPKNYTADSTLYTAKLDGETTLVRVHSTDTPIPTTFKIQKVDAGTGKVDAGLAGTKFNVFSDSACKKKIETITIGTDGIGNSSKKYYYGVTYYVREASTKAGWLLNTNKFSIKPTSTNKIPTLKVSNEPATGTFSIHKVPVSGYAPEDVDMSGAIFTIYTDKTMTKSVGTIKVDKDGRGTSPVLPIGDYWVQETKNPTGYEIMDTGFWATATIQGNRNEPYRVEEKYSYGRIEILKKDADTNSATPSNPNYSMDGAIYTIYSDENCTKVIPEFPTITITNGKGVSGLIKKGNYWVKETWAPEGYLADATKYPVTVGASETVQITSIEHPIKAPIVIEKHDADTGTTAPLNGLYSMDGAVYSIFSDQALTTLVDSVTISDGSGKSKNLPLGTYWVQETTAPTAYAKDDTIYSVVIAANSTPSTLKVISTDKPKKGSISIEKHDADTGTTEPLNGLYSMDGTVYTIYSDSELKNAVQSLTIANGVASTGNVLPLGNYWIQETSATSSYYRDDTIYTVTITASSVDTVVKIVSVDKPKKGAISIEKHDSLTGTIEPVNNLYSMDGAVYTIFSDEAMTNAVRTLTISNGAASTERDLPLGDYWVQETTAPNYYDRDTNIYKVTISPENVEGIIRVVSSDTPVRGKLAVQKVDAETGEKHPLAANLSFKDAVFGIYSDNACTDLVEEITTDDSGYAISSDLLINDYWIKEITPPTGYNRNDTVYACTADDMKLAISNGTVVERTVEESVIRGNITLVKNIDEDKGSIIQMPGNDLEGIRFVFTYVDDPSISFDVCGEQNTIITDEHGYSTTVDYEKYPVGTLIYGKWRISEVLKNNALIPVKDFELTVSENGAVYPYVVNNDRVRSYIQIVKKDANTDAIIPVSGVTFKIKTIAGDYVKMWDYKEGKYVDEFSTDSNGIIRFPNSFVYGEYILEEVYAPDGYSVGEDLTFSISTPNDDQENPITVVYKDEPQVGTISVTKLDESSKKSAGKGFTFSITVAEDIVDSAGNVRKGTDADGNTVELKKGTVVDRLTTGDDGKVVSKDLYLGAYTVQEIEAADFYTLGKTVARVTLAADRSVEKVSASTVFTNRKTKVVINKTDYYDSVKVLQGIVFRVFTDSDVDAKLINDYKDAIDAKSAELAKAVTDLQASNTKALNTLVEKQQEELKAFTDAGNSAEDVSKFTKEQEQVKSDLLMEQQDAVKDLEIFNQQSLTDYASVVQKQLGIDFSTLGTEFVTDAQGLITLSDLSHGRTYYVVETKTLDGYNLIPNVAEFSVDKDGFINGGADYSITISNTPNVVQIDKVDVTGAKEVPGATLELINSNGILVDTWVSTEEPHVIKGLAAGEYVLKETIAPNGYTKARDVSFTVTNTSIVQKVTMVDELTSVEVNKFDAETKEYVPGATLQIVKGSDVVYEWETTDKPYLIKGLPVGEYTLQEVKTPDGYATADPIKFSVTDEPGKTVTIEMNDAPLQIIVSKKSVELGDEELPGATLQILDSNGKEVKTWVTTAQPMIIKYLSLGDYTLKELSAPDGYSIAEDVKFSITDTARVQYVNMTDTYTKLEISKEDVTDGKELPGASLVVKDSTGTIIDSWVSSDKPHAIYGLKTGSYTLVETIAPDGYTTSEAIEFEITDTLDVQKVTMKDAPTTVTISKTTITGDEELPGAKLTIKDSNGNEVESWVSGDEPHTIVGLPIGTYTLIETTAPDGYTTAESVQFTVKDTADIQKVIMKDAPTTVTISKVDITNNEELPGAELTIKDSSGNEVESWVSTDEPHVIDGLPIGDYTLVEVTAPYGYATAESVQFTVKDTVKVQKVTMKDAPTTVKISKTDITGDKELPGVELAIKDSDGNEVESWISGDKPHTIKGLPIGTYTLVEVTAPDGYTVAEEIEFEVTDTTKVQKVVMKDAPTTVSFSKQSVTGEEELPGAKLLVKDSDGKEIESWVSDNEPHVIKGLPVGRYTLVEITAPSGYATAESVEFEVTNTAETQKVVMKDKQLVVEISKFIANTSEFLVGADLAVLDSDGNEIVAWTTTDKAYSIACLPVGDYTLVERKAPNGYNTAESIQFSVKDTEDIQKVTMYDTPRTDAPPTTTDVKTGDNSHAEYFAIIAVLSLGFLLMLRKRKRL